MRLCVLLAVSTLLSLGGCSGTPPVRHVEMKTDEFESTISFLGIAMSAGGNPLAGSAQSNENMFRIWQLRSWIDKHNFSVAHQIYITLLYNKGAGTFIPVKYALGDHGEKLPLRKLGQEKAACPESDACLSKEYVGVDVSDSSLRAHQMSGYRIKIESRAGLELIFPITTEMISLQLDAIDKIVPHKP